MAILIAVGLLTAGLGFMATKVGMNYKHGGLLPKTDSAYVEYERFLHTFKEDGNVLVIGTQGDTLGTHDLYTPANFKAWYQLGEDLKKIPGIDSVFSEAHLFTLLRDDSLQRFALAQVVDKLPDDQGQMDSLLARIRSLPFYKGLLYNDATRASLMMVFVNAKLFDTDARQAVIDAVRERTNDFGAETGMPVHRSGLPWIRVNSTNLVKSEMPMFFAASMGLCALLLLLFFRSWRVMGICMAVVAISVVWTFGCMALLDYRVTLLQSVIAPLVIVTGVPNCVFLVNAFHYEFTDH
ncbi:MAG TPA: MMPL family transporter, partial [Flavobacteriales bacterium]|nr:MMPL family transporter [Flavobacteriales bacterium]